MTNKISDNRPKIPVVILAGFLGSGKTTLLQQWLQWSLEAGMKPAVVMNEVGEVNLDGKLLPEDVAMTELLNGCICCSMRGDFSLKLYELVQSERPDIIYVECTGIAQPMELVDSITEISLYSGVVLNHIVTLADAAHLAALLEGDTPNRKLMNLLQEQVRVAQLILVNKADRVNEAQLEAVQRHLRTWNAEAGLLVTERAAIDRSRWLDAIRTGASPAWQERKPGCASGPHAHDKVTVWTRAIPRAVDSERFERWLLGQPSNVYRAKGIVTFTDTTKRYMFQYAYRATEFVPITPQGEVEDVIVMIGEQMDVAELERSFRVICQ
ncbi:MAG: GTP-binding protein [Paenibacillus dendritiformis]|uniref:CobW family GTP-binding protein n=1 Tax=uncultured Paenibacillus sp. TaxID=227322 RepID=UPI0025DECF26|nr:GTP-binding protein [uncultured Paenibacillus sp.]MDU5140669.1 GTP-binding protein [Paenibacillus dendritiformis]